MTTNGGASDDTVKKYILEIGGSAGDNGSGWDGNGGGGNGGEESKPAGDNKKFQDHLKRISGNTKKSLGATLGIKLGTASILKQSQVFTGYIGTIFQLMGAMVDVILAPFLPILIPAIRKMAEMIPYIRVYAQNIFDFLDRTLFEWIRNAIDWLPTGFKDKIIPALAMLLTGAFFLKMTGLWSPFFKLFGAIMRPLWVALSPVLKSLTAFAWKGLSALVGGFVKMTTDAVKAGAQKVWTKFMSPFFNAIKNALLKRVSALTSMVTQHASWLMNKALLPVYTWTKTFINKFISAFMTRLWAPFRGMFGKLMTRLAPLFRFMQAPLAKIGTFLMRLWPTLSDNFLTRFFTRLATSPVVKGALAFFSKKGVLGMAKAGASALGALAKTRGGQMAMKAGHGLRGVPILGSVAELGYGGYKAYQHYQKHGWGAAGGRLAMTGALATAGFFDPTGIASAGASIGGHLAMDYGYRRMDYRQSYLAAREGQTVDGKIVVQVADKSFELHHRDEITAEVQQQNGGTDKAYVE